MEQGSKGLPVISDPYMVMIETIDGKQAPRHTKTNKATYMLAGDQQYVGIAGVVGYLRQGEEGEVMVGETVPKVVRGKDTRSLFSGDISSHDDLWDTEIMISMQIL